MEAVDRAPALNGRTRLTAIFGDPVEHSQSPAMHNAAYAALSMERAYVPCHVVPENLRSAIHAIPALGVLGVNLTVPHKERAVRMMAAVSNEARALGAINCVINRPDGLYGDNTDARGLERDLRDVEAVVADQLAIVIGAGGAAAAVLLSCFRLGVRRIVICNRTVSRAKSLARRFGKYMNAQETAVSGRIIEVRGLDALLDPTLLSAAALILNATPMGLKTGGFAPLAYEATPEDCFFYDLVYAAEPTPFIKPAAALGRRTADGAGMLINQGELAFELFNQVAAPAGVMRRALMTQLGRLHR